MFEEPEHKQARIWQRPLKKKDIVLKKNDKTNWGRFLDNHYNPNIHQKPFGVSKKVPDNHYMHSKAGLSHNYKTIQILEKLAVEEQDKRFLEDRNFAELNILKEGEIYVFIEYCSNNEEKQISTRHIAEKYEVFAKRFRQGILEKFPFIKVFLKNDTYEDTVYKYKLYKDALDKNKIENQRKVVRVGAFEITLARVERNIKKTYLLFSKSKSKTWPSLPILLNKISNFLPRTILMVNVFDENNTENKDNIEGMEIK